MHELSAWSLSSGAREDNGKQSKIKSRSFQVQWDHSFLNSWKQRANYFFVFVFVQFCTSLFFSMTESWRAWSGEISGEISWLEAGSTVNGIRKHILMTFPVQFCWLDIQTKSYSTCQLILPFSMLLIISFFTSFIFCSLFVCSAHLDAFSHKQYSLAWT